MILFRNRTKLYEEVGMADVLRDTGLYKDAWRRLKRSPAALVAMGFIGFVVFLAIFGPYLTPHDPNLGNLMVRLKPPSATHWFGTDQLGRDVFSRVIAGTRISLFIGVVAELIALTIGVIMGTIAGFFGGWVDKLISRLIEILSSFPFLLFALAIMMVLGPGIINIFIAIGLLSWTNVARLIRGQVMRLKTSEYVMAARAAGANELSIIFKHLIPNCMSTIIVILTMDIPGAIMTETFFSYIGMGVRPPHASWGKMLSESRMYMRTAPTYSIFSGLLLMLTVLAFNTFGDALRDALDPRLKNK